jgi:microcystin degradation protein MlrC
LIETELMTRIAVGGFLHETNTFAPTKATYDDFVHGGGWPAMAHGADVLKTMRSINVGLAGFVEQAEANDWEMVPTISCGASPSAHVTKDAFERIVGVMVDGIAAAGPLDAVYLDLHGAMVTEHIDDGEGEILARVRKVIGKDMPLVVSLDLHANVTPQMVERADALIAYRTYPHVDMADTGRAPAIAFPDSDQLAMHQRSTHQGHLSKACGAGGPCGADAVICAGLPGCGFRPLRTERVRLWPDPG